MISLFLLCYSKLAEEELQLNVANREVFAFPAEGEKEITSLPEVEQRIKDVLLVLSNFNKFREEGRWVGYFKLLTDNFNFVYILKP